MINRRTMFLLLFLSMVALVLGGVGRAEDPAKSSPKTAIPPVRIVISYPIGESPKMGTVQKYFSHESHSQEYKVACTVCHHVYENGKNIWNEGMPIQKCSECHDASVLEGRKDLAAGFQLRSSLDHPSCALCHRAGKGD